jgi:quinol monooxygenase YgiN
MIAHNTQGSAPMKYNMIRYQFANGTPEDWHREVARFIAALDSDPDLKGRIGYRVMKNRDDASYFHLASVADEEAVKTLQSREFFKAYQAKTRAVAAGGQVTVTPIEVIGETAA